MSSYSLADDGMDNSHDWNYTPSNFNHRNYSIDNYEDDDDEDESERFGKPMTITIPIENINKLQYESEFKHISLNTRINQNIS
jgi:outer membrane protein assembly factor BamA